MTTQPITKKYHNKDLNIAYNDGIEKGEGDIIKHIKRFLSNLNNLHYAEQCSLCEHKLGVVVDTDELKDFLENLKVGK